MSENPFNWLQRFYQNLRDGDWEHARGYGCAIVATGVPGLMFKLNLVSEPHDGIEAMSHPGWLFKFNMIGTSYEDIELDQIADNFAPLSISTKPFNWIVCCMREGEFIAACSSHRLGECIDILRDVVEGRRGYRRLRDAPTDLEESGGLHSPLIIEPNGRARPALPGEIPR